MCDQSAFSLGKSVSRIACVEHKFLRGGASCRWFIFSRFNDFLLIRGNLFAGTFSKPIEGHDGQRIAAKCMKFTLIFT